MNNVKTLEIVKQIITDKLGDQIKKKIEEDDRLREDLGLDSIHLVDLTVAIEDRFNIRFDPINVNLIEVFKTVGSLMKYIAECIYDGKG